MTEQITEALETFVRQAGQVAADDPLFSRDVDLIETGYLDSVGVVALLTYLETSFHVTVDDDTWAALDPLTINGISALVGFRL